jgi:tetratricopeptide (TPR) repeat protein
MSLQRRPTDIWGNWPQWSLEGEIVRGAQDNSKMLHAIHQSLDSRLRNLRIELPEMCLPDDIHDEVDFGIQDAIIDLSRFIKSASGETQKAIGESTKATVFEIRRLAEYLGCSMAFLGDKMDESNRGLNMLNWSVTKLIDLEKQILNVLRNPLATVARECTEQGLVWFYQNESELAEKALLKSLESDSTNYLAYYHLGHVYMHCSKWKKAERNFELAAKCACSSADKARSLSCGAKVCYCSSEIENAYKLALRASELVPEQGNYWFECAVYAATSEQYKNLWPVYLEKAIMLDDMYYVLSLDQLRFVVDIRQVIEVGQIVLQEKARLQRLPWKTIELGTQSNADGYREALKQNGFCVGDWADGIMGKPAFTVANQPETIDLELVTVAELGFPDRRQTLRDIYEKALSMGLSLCSSEVGPALRLAYPDQLDCSLDALRLRYPDPPRMSEHITVGMKPITHSDGYSYVFYIINLHNVCSLDTLRVNYNNQDHYWCADDHFVFCRRK